MNAARDAVTFLFVPGDRPDRFAKAVATGADCVILDLEDAVQPSDKIRARSESATWLAGEGTACVRVNAWETPEHQADLAAVADLPGLIAIVLAKAELASTLAVTNACRVPVIPLIESAAGVADAAAVAALPGVVRLAFGHLDYAVDVRAQPTRTAMLHARSTLVHASRLAGLPGPVDGVTTALDATELLEEDVRHARELGMTAKLLIHPRQVMPTQAGFRPDEESVRWARGVVAAVANGSAVGVDGHMVDAPVLARARLILGQAD